MSRLILLGRIQVVAPRRALDLKLIFHLPGTESKLIVNRCLRLIMLHVVPPDGHAAKLAGVMWRVNRFVLDPFLSLGRG